MNVRNINELCGTELFWFRSFSHTVTCRTIVVCIMAAASTYFCYENGLKVNLRTDLIGIAVVFPIVFSISQAFKRREDALHSLSIVKGNALALRLAYLHWNGDDRLRKQMEFSEASVGSFGELQSTLLGEGDRELEELFSCMKQYLSAPQVSEAEHVKVVISFTKLSLLSEKLRTEGGVSAPEISRVNEYLRVMMVNFQLMKHIRVYSTPTNIRAYTKFFLAIFPVVFGPAFADMAGQANALWIGILMACIYSLVLVGLDNIQDALENPFDGLSEDDIRFDAPNALLTHSIVGVHGLPVDGTSSGLVNEMSNRNITTAGVESYDADTGTI